MEKIEIFGAKFFCSDQLEELISRDVRSVSNMNTYQRITGQGRAGQYCTCLWCCRDDFISTYAQGSFPRIIILL